MRETERTVEFEIGFSSELSVILFFDPYFMRINLLWLAYLRICIRLTHSSDYHVIVMAGV